MDRRRPVYRLSASVAPDRLGSSRLGRLASRPCRAASERMSMRQPVSRAASRAFWPSLPIASESW